MMSINIFRMILKEWIWRVLFTSYTVGVGLKGYFLMWPYIDGLSMKQINPFFLVPVVFLVIGSGIMVIFKSSFKFYTRSTWIFIIDVLGFCGIIGYLFLEPDGLWIYLMGLFLFLFFNLLIRVYKRTEQLGLIWGSIFFIILFGLPMLLVSIITDNYLFHTFLMQSVMAILVISFLYGCLILLTIFYEMKACRKGFLSVCRDMKNWRSK